jgi:hypothetical protein
MNIASDLVDAQEEKLLDVLREHKEVIGWTIEDFKGTSPQWWCTRYIWRRMPTIKGATEKAQPRYARGCEG